MTVSTIDETCLFHYTASHKRIVILPTKKFYTRSDIMRFCQANGLYNIDITINRKETTVCYKKKRIVINIHLNSAAGEWYAILSQIIENGGSNG